MKQAIPGVTPFQAEEVTSMEIWPSICATSLGRFLGQLYSIRVGVGVVTVGNLIALASIPLALCEAVEQGRLKPDDNIVFVGFGGGLTWASAVIKWNVTPPEVSRLDRELQRTRYLMARGRSKLRRWGRRWGAILGGSPTPDARMRDAQKPRHHEHPEE